MSEVKTPPIKGYNLSTDYIKLWELIHSGHQIVGWMLEDESRSISPLWFIVQIREDSYNPEHYIMGTRGFGYEDNRNGLAGFIANCIYWRLHYITPNETQL